MQGHSRVHVVIQFPDPKLKVCLVQILGPVVNQAPDPVPSNERFLFLGFTPIPTNWFALVSSVVEEPPP